MSDELEIVKNINHTAFVKFKRQIVQITYDPALPMSIDMIAERAWGELCNDVEKVLFLDHLIEGEALDIYKQF